MKIISVSNIFLTALMYAVITGTVLAQPPTDRAETATIKPGSNWSPPGQEKSVAFAFPEGEVTLTSSGAWSAKGWIRHAGILCGRYSVGVQFGIGSPGCISVEWKNEPQFSVSKSQCNNAILKHLVYEKIPELKKSFEKITCARRVVRCRGNCKGSGGTFTNEQ